jgi:SpoVK/Ycf46/Vps4 family AAA+-type ATPase
MVSAFANNWHPFTDMYLNFILTGRSGVGKTVLARHMGEILRYSGIVFSDLFLSKTRSSFIGNVVGESGPKTLATLEEAVEGVLFLDEAYQLASCERAEGGKCVAFDSYGEEAIAEILTYLQDHKGQTIMIMAGYKDKIDASVLAVNEGVTRRFPFQWNLDDYSKDDLWSIFVKQMQKVGMDETHLHAKAKRAIKAIMNAQSFYDGGVTPVLLKMAGDTENLVARLEMYRSSRGINIISGEAATHIIQKYILKTGGLRLDSRTANLYTSVKR